MSIFFNLLSLIRENSRALPHYDETASWCGELRFDKALGRHYHRYLRAYDRGTEKEKNLFLLIESFRTLKLPRKDDIQPRSYERGLLPYF